MAMVKTMLLPMEKAATIQATHEQFNCRLIEIGVCSSTSAKVTVTGEENDVKCLFESIGEKGI